MSGTAKRRRHDGLDMPVRERILAAAFREFMEKGYAGASTLEIATRARVSKRELYALVGNKHAMLVACIRSRAGRLALPADVPELADRETLARTLVAVGAQLLREVGDPTVIAVFRLAIAEAVRAPEVALALDAIGGEASRVALRDLMEQGRSAGLLAGDPARMAEQFAGLLWGGLMIRLLLGVAERPPLREIERRARDATDAFLRLHGPSG